jgi:hypothetical protein
MADCAEEAHWNLPRITYRGLAARVNENAKALGKTLVLLSKERSSLFGIRALFAHPHELRDNSTAIMAMNLDEA